MTESSEIFQETKEYPRAESQNLSLIEHRFIGGSEEIGGVFYDGKKLIEDAKNGPLPQDYFKPVGFLKGAKSLEQTAIERNGRYIRGALSFLGESGMELFEEGYETVIELADVDPITGIHDSKWRLFLLKEEKEEVERRLLERLKPIGVVPKVLDFELKDDGFHLSYNPKI